MKHSVLIDGSAMSLSAIAAAVLFAVTAVPAQAADADQLGSQLTPVGAEPGPNKDGSIPKWEGKDVPQAGWAQGKYRGDYWAHKGEKPLFSIDASNVDKYADKLTPGQVELIKKTKGYKMDVYPTHRNCGFPEWVNENTKKNVGFAKLADNGYDIKDAYLPGVPFPIPENGAQAIWNHKLRYTGIGWEIPQVRSLASPRKGSNEWIDLRAYQIFYYPWGGKGSKKISELPPQDSMTFFKYESPAALAGQAAILNTAYNADSESFYYFPGQRRVRRLPSYSYDAPSIGWESEYPVDIISGYYGRIDRFDWKLVGKKEIYIPYNDFAAYDFRKEADEAFKPDMPEKNGHRYELHRVWVVEGTVKNGVRHSAPKRRFYLDEDTWSLVVADDYDAKGNLWMVRETEMIPAWDANNACMFSAFVNYNLVTGRYITDQQPVGSHKDVKFFAEPGNNRALKPDFYTPENLRSLSER
ncbi:DUF1329 domain-containing protein [Herbaspirillum huttiense]|uniref:DUF1329 domain-containing protein n=1 Tax=Herbaspirillum huttiense TaxID=863372 RepID=UPI0010650B77|nr:DUF1329 domain-containing protein [Herbaspirillum huttiense]QBP77735.1 DUF1329 domain-containing protein [Herbaspirillum huttiense]